MSLDHVRLADYCDPPLFACLATLSVTCHWWDRVSLIFSLLSLYRLGKLDAYQPHKVPLLGELDKNQTMCTDYCCA